MGHTYSNVRAKHTPLVPLGREAGGEGVVKNLTQMQDESLMPRRAFLCCATLLCVLLPTGARADSAALPAIKPYRVLVVVNQWSDPASLLISRERDRFQPVAALLKAWSIPFDILRLDQQHLDGSYLFRRSGAIRYGAVVWLADSPSYATQDVASLLVAQHRGMSVIVVNSRFLDPALDELLGLKFKEVYTATTHLRIAQGHFITRDLEDRKIALPDTSWNFSERLWVEPRGAEVLITQGRHPLLTVKQSSPQAGGIWIGAPDLSLLCQSSFWRDIFFRSLVWSLGYVVRPNVDYAHRVIFELDDWGTADKGFLSYWRYLEPDEQTIRQYLIAPLEHHQAVASAEVDTGYVDRASKAIVSPWTKSFTDLYGLHQDYASTWRGLKEAVAQGVLEIESHGWTHMNPDLESPPGPWWTADLAGEASVDGWYGEFADHRRGKEVPAITQLVHMKRSLEYLRNDFGVEALELKPGNDAWSHSQFNNTAALAPRAGFGLFHGDNATYYLDRGMALDMADVIPDFNTSYDRLAALHPERWPDHSAGPVVLGFHDRDIALDHNFLRRLFAALPSGYKTMATNQYVGILHTRIGSSAGNAGWQLTFGLDNHYCSYFARHASSWRLWLSDPLRTRLASAHPAVSVDGKPAIGARTADFHRESITIDLPAGLRTHVWKME